MSKQDLINIQKLLKSSRYRREPLYETIITPAKANENPKTEANNLYKFTEQLSKKLKPVSTQNPQLARIAEKILSQKLKEINNLAGNELAAYTDKLQKAFKMKQQGGYSEIAFNATRDLYLKFFKVAETTSKAFLRRLLVSFPNLKSNKAFIRTVLKINKMEQDVLKYIFQLSDKILKDNNKYKAMIFLLVSIVILSIVNIIVPIVYILLGTLLYIKDDKLGDFFNKLAVGLKETGEGMLKRESTLQKFLFLFKKIFAGLFKYIIELFKSFFYLLILISYAFLILQKTIIMQIIGLAAIVVFLVRLVIAYIFKK